MCYFRAMPIKFHRDQSGEQIMCSALESCSTYLVCTKRTFKTLLARFACLLVVFITCRQGHRLVLIGTRCLIVSSPAKDMLTRVKLDYDANNTDRRSLRKHRRRQSLFTGGVDSFLALKSEQIISMSSLAYDIWNLIQHFVRTGVLNFMLWVSHFPLRVIVFP